MVHITASTTSPDNNQNNSSPTTNYLPQPHPNQNPNPPQQQHMQHQIVYSYLNHLNQHHHQHHLNNPYLSPPEYSTEEIPTTDQQILECSHHHVYFDANISYYNSLNSNNVGEFYVHQQGGGNGEEVLTPAGSLYREECA